MKERIKECLLVVFVIYIIVIAFSMILTYFKMDRYVEFYEDNTFYLELGNYKKEVEKVKNKACQTELNNLIISVEEANLNGLVDFKDYFDTRGEGYLMNYYADVKEACSISDEKAKEEKLPIMILTATIQYERIILDYMHQYEIHLKDNYMREATNQDIQNLTNKIKREEELNIINTLLKIVNNKENANEN